MKISPYLKGTHIKILNSFYTQYTPSMQLNTNRHIKQLKSMIKLSGLDGEDLLASNLLHVKIFYVS